MKQYRNLTSEEVDRLKGQGCTSDDWSGIQVSRGFTTSNISYTRFTGEVLIGALSEKIEFPGGLSRNSGLTNVHLHNCTVGDQVFISNVRNYIANYHISDHVVIENTDLIVMEGSSSFGNGTMVNVLDETGGRHLMIYDRLTAPLAYIMAFYRHRNQIPEMIECMIREYAENTKSARGYIGPHSTITNCSQICNVRVGSHAQICGASRLTNGSVNSNVYDPVKVGYNVVAENFIFSSGSEVTDHAIVENSFVGQGCVLSKHYSATHSLFFANCQGFNGEACSIFAGPFTVSHHKSTLLIAGMFSFANAGSGSNQSNHMYKLGPIHHGIVERGSKTTSDSYLLWPAKIGPFTLVMGRHYKNTDTSHMPFSYLIEHKDESWLSPAVNLRSVGTIRDAMKWPQRDKRKDPELLDPINFNLLSPFTIQRMLQGKKILEQIQTISGETTDTYSWETTFISRTSLIRGLQLYDLGIIKFLGNSVISRIQKSQPRDIKELRACLVPDSPYGSGDWIDLAGLIAPKNEIDRLINDLETGIITDLGIVESLFKDLHARYYTLEWTWASSLMQEFMKKPIMETDIEDLTLLIQKWMDAVTGLDRMLYEDARKEFRLSAMTGFGPDGDTLDKEMDFANVRGTFEKNTFVQEILEHIRKKNELGQHMIAYLRSLKN